MIENRNSALNEIPSNGKNFIFVHGYNVSEEKALGWHCEMFKRLYWSGSNAKFYGITWRGDQSRFPFTSITPNYHINVPNAWDVAEDFRDYLNTLSGEKIVAAHSLGNMLVSAAIQDYSAPVSKFFMIDAAVAMEAYDDTASDTNAMVHPDWVDFSNRLWATEWHQLWDSGDERSKLTWRGRFANVVSKAYNFYSSGEEVLERHDTTPIKLSVIWNKAQYAWCMQEKLKGRSVLFPFPGSTYGGWGFNSSYYGHPGWYEGDNHLLISDGQLRFQPFCDRGWIGVWPLYYNSGSTYAQKNHAKLLAQMIPSLSLAAGANEVTKLNQYGERNFNMDTDDFKNGWGRNHSTFGAQWLHSDIREMSYLYTHEVFDKFVDEGGME